MRSLILGCGYLGRRLLERWLSSGNEIFVTTRSEDHARALQVQGATAVVCDVTKPESLRSLPQVDHLVWAVGLDRTAGLPMQKVYVEGLENVLTAISSKPRWVHISSTSVYGQTNGELVDESAPTTPREESGQIVLEAEQLLLSYQPDAMILRFAGIYGPGRLLRSRDIQAGNPLAVDPRKWLNLIHVADGVSAVEAAFQKGTAGQIYNVCDDTPIRRDEFYSALARKLQAPPPNFVLFDATATQNESDRRISNTKMRRELGVELAYPSCHVGLAGLS